METVAQIFSGPDLSSLTPRCKPTEGLVPRLGYTGAGSGTEKGYTGAGSSTETRLHGCRVRY